MAFHLSVVVPFGSHQRGDMITDEAEVAEVLSGENSANVAKVTAPAAVVEKES